MVCHHPNAVIPPAYVNKNCFRSQVFVGGYFKFCREHSLISEYATRIPCGQCMGCRMARAQAWAIRCQHEASLYKHNIFLTLTYREEDLPPGRTLVLRDFQLFMKKLRDRFNYPGIRYFHCGEYGENFTQRPHYHALLFNFDFIDKKHFKMSKCGKYPVYRSPTLEDLWPYGNSEFGCVTYHSAAYVARYSLKKVGRYIVMPESQDFDDDESYEMAYKRALKDKELMKSGLVEYMDPYTGAFGWRKAEYHTMSRRPGIGKAWFDKYWKDLYPADEVVLAGKKYKLKPPKFYDNQYELLYPEDYAMIKQRRLDNMKQFEWNNTEERLLVRKEVLLRRVKDKLVRNLDSME